ncbi:hypothetical protein [Nocardia sp. CDC160]|uniref:hypothetical protein n=1 Tax=Nocardia sp. CDC160 TaxID=3112166 RepID=UPI002DB7E90C|nr:hypothetical protein [Nocardia sp. CDC160]MEC3919246.1 hypothetical protein [Nocardia sp. CDC160]
MSADGSASGSGAQDPVVGLQQQAIGGKLLFDPDAAVVAAKACGDLVGELLAVSEKVGDLKSLKALATTSSGKLLSGQLVAERYIHTADQLNDRLRDYRMLAQELSDLFVAAGNAFVADDRSSAQSLERVEMPSTPGGQGINWPDPKAPLPSELGINGAFMKASAPVQGAFYAKGQQSAIGAENPDSMAYHDMYDIGASISQALPSVYYVGNLWGVMATTIDGAFGQLVAKINQLSDMWQGHAWDSVSSVIQARRAESEQLTSSMHLIATELGNTLQWLADTKVNMPASPEPRQVANTRFGGAVTTTAAVEAELHRARQAMATYYVPGVHTASASVPTLPAPTIDPAALATDVGGGKSPLRLVRKEPDGRADIGGGGASIQSRAMPLMPSVTPPTSSPATPGAITAPSGLEGQTNGGSPAQQQEAQNQSRSGQDLSQLSDMGEKAMQAAQQAASLLQSQQKSPAPENNPDIPFTPAMVDDPAALGGGGLGGDPGLSSGAGTPNPLEPDLTKSPVLAGAKLPIAEPEAVQNSAPARAGLAAQSGMPGYPGGMGGANAGAGQGKEYKRPVKLESSEHMKAALGDPVEVSEPVLD